MLLRMRIFSLQMRQVRIPFRFSFRHALAERRQADSIIISLHSRCGVTGWGEAVPRAYLTGESVDSVWDDIRTLWWPQLREIDFASDLPPTTFLQKMYKEADYARKTAGYAAIDLAAHDLLARLNRKPLAEFMGFIPRRVCLSAPLGGSSLRGVTRSARLFKWLGFREFKLKAGLCDDAANLRAVRAIVGAGADIRIDANAAWDAGWAVDELARLREFNISSVEQPCADVAGLARVRRETGLPVMADESICTTADARALLAAGAADIWNLRLAKNGGFCGLLNLLALAREHGVRLHLGTLVGETSLLAAAGRIAAGAAEFAHVEYGFPRILLRPDPFGGGPAGYFGTGNPPNRKPGFGVTADLRALEGVTLRKVTLS